MDTPNFDYNLRLKTFLDNNAEHADLFFFPLSADLQYLTGIRREMPNFGAVLHPGMWIEGLWIAPNQPPVLALPRMTAEFGGLGGPEGIATHILGDHDDPTTLLENILEPFQLGDTPRIAIGDSTRGETVVGLNLKYPTARYLSATALLSPQRRIKSAEEIAVLREAGRITQAAFDALFENLSFGVTELEVMQEVDYQLKVHGSKGPSFVTALYCVGPKHELIFGHAEQKWHRELQPPVSILFDFGAILDGYCYDFGRTVFFGEPDPESVKVYETVLASQSAGVRALIPGKTAASADAAARGVIEKAGYGPNFRHRLGHSIGLDVHEAPFLTASDETQLAEGMCFTVEPSILRENALSARIEDIVVVGKRGGEKLTSTTDDIYIVES